MATPPASPAGDRASRRRLTPRTRALAGLGAILLLVAANGMLVRNTGCAPNAHYALVRSLDRGTPTIDRYHWQTCDKSFANHHFYAAKAPGLAFAALPVYAVLHGAGLAHENLPSSRTWHAGADDTRRAIWPLTLWTVVLPAGILLLLVQRLARELEPDYGTATAVLLGVATLILPYGSLFFSHVLATCLGFAAFAVLWRERRGPPSPIRLAAAGALAGLAVTAEYPLGVLLAGLGLYAISRRPLVQRGLAYGAGALAGLLPLLLYSWWAFGSPFRLSYAGAVIDQGQSGHDTLGLNSTGFFGVGMPNPHIALGLLVSENGLLRLVPVLALALPALVLLYRRGDRAEALLVAGLAVAFVAYDSGYWLPLGGDAPGPRFLIPIVPFLVYPMALVFRRLGPAVFVLGAISALGMLAMTATSTNDLASAWSELRDGRFSETVLSFAGAGSGWIAIAPFAVAVVAACALTALAVGPQPVSRRGIEVGLVALGAWLLVTQLGTSRLVLDTANPRDPALLLALAACAATVAQVYRKGARELWKAAPLVVLAFSTVTDSPYTVLLVSVLVLALLLAPWPRARLASAG